MRTLRSLLIVFFILALVQCASRVRYAGAPEIPADRARAEAFTPVPSTINIPMEIKTKYIENMINEQLSGLIWQCDTMTLGSFKNVGVRVWKQDSIRISLEADELRYHVPLKISLRFSFTIGALGLSHTEYQDVDAGIALTLRSRIFLKNDWKLVTMTKPEGYTWTTDPIVKIHFISIPVKPVADFILAKQYSTIGGIIDKSISGTLSIKKTLTPLWNQLQEPISFPIPDNPRPLWLKLTPTDVYMTQLEGSEGIIRSSIGVKTIAETYIGEKPDTVIKAGLPDFAIPGKVDSTFVVNLYSELSFEQATLISREQLMGKEFGSGKQRVIVQDVEVQGIDGFTVVKLDLTGSFRGRVFVVGRMVYDEKKSVLSIEDLDYDLTTKSALQSTAGWLFQGVIMSKIKPLLSFPLKEKLLEAHLVAQQMLSNKEIYKGVFLNGRIDSLSIGGIQLTENCFRTVILAKGNLTVRVQD